jgi:hypothetical protein
MIEPLKRLRGLSTLKRDRDLEFFEDSLIRNTKYLDSGIILLPHFVQGDPSSEPVSWTE